MDAADATTSLLQKTTRPGGFFITGTDTEIGKTYAACCLGASFRKYFPEMSLFPRKPIASGARQEGNRLISEDAEQLKRACASEESLDHICAYTMKPAISPQRAIRQANLNLTIYDLYKAAQPLESGLTLVEGAGGFYSPIAINGLNSDLAKALKLPVILVVGNRLGCLNHALLTVKAIERSGLPLAAVILNDMLPDSDPDNFSDLRSLLPGTHCVHLKYSTNQDWQIFDDSLMSKLEYFFPF